MAEKSNVKVTHLMIFGSRFKFPGSFMTKDRKNSSVQNFHRPDPTPTPTPSQIASKNANFNFCEKKFCTFCEKIPDGVGTSRFIDSWSTAICAKSRTWDFCGILSNAPTFMLHGILISWLTFETGFVPIVIYTEPKFSTSSFTLAHFNPLYYE